MTEKIYPAWFEPTHTKETEAAYLKRAAGLLKRYSKEKGLPKDEYGKLASWLEELKPAMAVRSWRLYKAALVCYLDVIGQYELRDALKLLNSSGCKAKGKKSEGNTSQKKKKNVSQIEEETLTQYLNTQREEYYWALRTLIFFKATLVTGLRPEEWRDAVYLEENLPGINCETPALRVKNAKATNGRAHGEYRHLILTNMSESDINTILLQLQFTDVSLTHGLLGSDGKLTWTQYYESIRKCLYRAYKVLFPRAESLVSIYSCRHQCIADLKTVYSRAEVAAMVGHATDRTATDHYGKKNYGRRGRLPKPHPPEVERIRHQYSARPDKIQSIGLH